MSNWNFAEVWEVVAEDPARRPGPGSGGRPGRLVGARPASRRLRRRRCWQAGLGRQAKVAQYLYNGPEYLESVFGAFKAGMVPVNTNYRYTEIRAGLPLGQRRRRGRGVPRLVRRAGSSVRPRLPGVRQLVVGRRRE